MSFFGPSIIPGIPLPSLDITQIIGLPKTIATGVINDFYDLFGKVEDNVIDASKKAAKAISENIHVIGGAEKPGIAGYVESWVQNITGLFSFGSGFSYVTIGLVVALVVGLLFALIRL